MPTRDQLTAVIIVRNEAFNLPACLDSLRLAVDRVLVLDTGSTDDTQELLQLRASNPAQEPPLTWFIRAFDDFSTTRTAALDLVETSHFLWIDADERLSPELAALLPTLDLGDHDLWQIRRENRVLGRVMTCRSLGEQFVARLACKAKVRLSGARVHEGLVLMDPTASVGRIEEPLHHEALTAVRPYLRKIDLYTTLEARDGRSHYGLLQPLHILVTGPRVMWREYVWRGGWRDGWQGLVWAGLSAWSATLRSWKVGKVSAGRER